MFIRLLNFSGFLASIVNSSNHTKCKFLNNQQCMNQPTLINFHPNEYGQGLRYYPFAINLDLSNRVSVPKKKKI